jgi:hypothetical protein
VYVCESFVRAWRFPSFLCLKHSASLIVCVCVLVRRGVCVCSCELQASVTAVRLMDLKDMTCPVYNTEFCGGSERGTCLETKMCKCTENYRGYACNYKCPMDVNGTKACSGNGQCSLSDTTSEDGRPYVCMGVSGF